MSKASRLAAPLRRIRRLWHASPASVVIVAFTITAYVVSLSLQGFEGLYQFSRSHEGWNIDELFTALMLLGLGLSTLLALRSKRLKREMERRQDAERKMERALATMHQGLAMFDSSSTLVICNARYTELHGLPAELATPGTPFLAIL